MGLGGLRPQLCSAILFGNSVRAIGSQLWTADFETFLPLAVIRIMGLAGNSR
jgi:hypothetical protein